MSVTSPFYPQQMQRVPTPYYGAPAWNAPTAAPTQYTMSPAFGSFAQPAQASPNFGGFGAPATTTNASGGPLVVAQIDQFTTDSTGFNHGEEVARMLRSGGNEPSLNGQVQLLQYNVAGGNATSNILGALQNVIQRVMSGQKIDAVNISQQDFASNANTGAVRQAISWLASAGVPVAVAAGNYGPQNINQLAPPNAFIVEASQNGAIKSDSGPGNIVSPGSYTSFATANLTPVLAKMHASGMSAGQIYNQLT